jgi:hypothetical protein
VELFWGSDYRLHRRRALLRVSQCQPGRAEDIAELTAAFERLPYALGIDHGPHGEPAMSVVLNDLLLFSCLTALVTGIVIAAATLII